MSASPVRGVETLNRAFALAGKQTRRELPLLFRGQIRPIERAAEANAGAIGVGVPWSQMRSVVNRRSAYIAPEKRGTRIAPRKRPKFATRLITRAMEPALAANRAQVEAGIDQLLARIEREFNRG